MHRFLVALGLEQAGKLLARTHFTEDWNNSTPLDNDYWYRLALAYLHYMAGGHRIQAAAVLHYFQNITQELQRDSEYVIATESFRNLYEGRVPPTRRYMWETLLFDDAEPDDSQLRKIFKLSKIVSQRRRLALDELGEGDERNWLAARGIRTNRSRNFWRIVSFKFDKKRIYIIYR